MALDGITLNHLVRELAPQIIGARIDKIQQPEKEEIHLSLRQVGKSLKLLLNVSASSARLQLTEGNKKNPPSPPMFCMILRKHLEGGKITGLSQAGLERIVVLSVQNYNEYGDLATLCLNLEIMGKHSNLLLIDPATNTILDGLKRYSHALSRHREVLPGRPYIAPPSQGKFDPIADDILWREVIYQAELDSPVLNIISSRFAGIGPELAREIVCQSGLEMDARLEQCGEIDLGRLYQSYTRLANPSAVAHTKPRLVFAADSAQASPLSFTFLPFAQYHGLPAECPPTLNEAIRLFYERKEGNSLLEAKRGSLRKVVQEQRAHQSKKLGIHEDTIASAQKSFSYQKWGEFLTANLYRLIPGTKEITVEDYYLEGFPPVTIPLEPNLSGIENAQRYYRLYNKAKAALQKTEPLRNAALAELAYLDSLLVSLEQASSLTDLEDIHAELAEEGYVSSKPTKGKDVKNRLKAAAPQPRNYQSSTGKAIFVGKNNKQNDWLSMKKGRPSDLWLHVKNIPGSHVLIPLNEDEEFPDDATLEEAAALAVYYSQARGSSLVPVDYTHIRNLKKPNGSKPGMVVYEKNWTLYLTPKKEVLEHLLHNNPVADSSHEV